MKEIFRSTLPTGRPHEELCLLLVSSQNSLEVHLAVLNRDRGQSMEKDLPLPAAPIPGPRSIILPLALWPRFHEAVCCLGASMKPLPAPAYQSTACCTYTCPAAPGPVVLGDAGQEQLRLRLQDRRGSTFLEIRAIKPGTAMTEPEEAHTIHIGPTLWSAFWAALARLNQFIADL
jgi:hypothetical protein